MDTLFCDAVAAAKESKLLTTEKLFRMADGASESDALKIAREVGFGGDAQTLADACAAEDQALIEFIRGYSPDGSAAALLFSENDFRNAEAVSKAEHLGLELLPLLSPEGLFDPDELKECAEKEEYVGLPEELRGAFEAADAAFAAGTDGIAVGAIFARACARYRLRIGKKIPLAYREVVYRIDTTNIATCARTRSFAQAQKMLLPGGNVGEQDLRKVCESTPDVIAAAFLTTPYREFADAVIEAMPRALVQAEKLQAEHWIGEMKRFRLEARGLLPFLSYVCYKRIEIANVRIVAAGLRNRLERGAIAERLRNGYEG